jgi:hypothetical protein
VIHQPFFNLRGGQPSLWLNYFRAPSVPFFFCQILVSTGLLGGFLSADPVASLKSFTEFHGLDPSRLLDGEILGERGALMNFPQGIFAQTCFAVPLSTDETARRLQLWDPSQHQSPNVLSFNTVPVPCALADFQNLELKADQRSQKWLLDRSLETSAAKSELNLTRDEARQLAECAKGSPEARGISACWAKLLQDRAKSFQCQGFTGLSPYEVGGKPVSLLKLLQTMLLEKQEVAREFAPLLEQCGIVGQAVSKLTPFYYWGLCEANRRGTLNLGAVYSLSLGDRHQLLDVQYYVSGTYYTIVTLYELWPIQVGSRIGTLVWRGDFFAAPSLALTRGTERLAYGAIMRQELKKAVRCFQNDATATAAR